MFVLGMRRVWRSGTEIAGVVRLIETGLSDREVARATVIPYETIRAWRRGRLPERARRVLAGVPECAGCGGAEHDRDALPPDDYAYLLGMYLGDGCLARTGRGGYSLRITLDSVYPGIIEVDVRRSPRSRAARCRTLRHTERALAW
jgi:hypothetical protein